MCDSHKNSNNDKGDDDMLARVDEFPENVISRKQKREKTNLLASAQEETFKTMNELTKRNRGLSNLTYKDLRREE